MSPLLDIQNLSVSFKVRGGRVHAVRDVSLSINAGETLAVVGESGCGKTVSMMALMGLLDTNARIDSGCATFADTDLLSLTGRELNRYRGARLAMIFQDPMSALNPTLTIGEQIAEPLVVHRGMSWGDAFVRAKELLDLTQVPEARARLDQYPFEFSGGMLQRAMIAMALACEPELLIADEPTTALDVTVQRQVMNLLAEIQRERQMAMLLITHDLGVVAEVADRVAVFYAGQVVEQGSVEDIFKRTAHPYTRGLKQALPALAQRAERLTAIPGSPPDLFAPPAGCGFAPRCDAAMNCCQQPPEIFSCGEHQSRCWLHHPKAPDCGDIVRLKEGL